MLFAYQSKKMINYLKFKQIIQYPYYYILKIYMDFDSRREKLKQIKQMLKNTIAQKRASKINENILELDKINIEIPSEQLFNQLSQYTKQLNHKIQDIYKTSTLTLKQINTLKNKKQNISKLMDTVTSILQIKRISYNLGNNNQQLYRNIKTFYEIKHKAIYCNKYIQSIQKQINALKQKYKEEFDKELKSSNSTNLTEYSRILNLIPDQNEPVQLTNSLDKLIQLYSNLLSKQFLVVQEQLFKIPITSNIEKQYVYIFFDILKNALKIFVNNFKIYKANTFKLHAQEGVHKLLISLITKNLNPIISQIFKRQKKYFQIQKIPADIEKKSLKEKDLLKIEHFCAQYRSICNQIQRLILYLKENTLNNQYPKYMEFINQLNQSMNCQTLIEMNNLLITYSQVQLKQQLNQLIKKSVFITSIWRLQADFFASLQKQSLNQIPDMHDFLDQMFLIFQKGIQEACLSLNKLIISSIINYLNTCLIHQDSFYVFNQIFKKFSVKLSLTPSIYQTAIILVINSLQNFTLNFNFLKKIKIAQELPKDKLKIQLEELEVNNIQKSKQLMKQYFHEICNLPYFRNQLETNYKLLTKGWERLSKQTFDIFIEILSEHHANYIKQTGFTKKYDQLSILSFEKQIRNIIKYYQQISTVNILHKFRVVLTYCSVLMLENEEDLQKFIKELPTNINITQVKEIFELKKK